MPVVIVTGAAGGIGASICAGFSQAGYRVIGVDCRDLDQQSWESVRFDLRHLRCTNGQCESFYRKVEEFTEGRLDVLVNNAAVQSVKPVESITPADWDVTLETNLLAPFLLVQRLLPLLRAARGSVVNIASVHARLTKPHFTLYATSKGALVTLTRALALELAPEVRVNAVLPAATDTQMLRGGFSSNPNALNDLGSYHPLGRIANPKEVAQVVLFLASPQASFVTGATFGVDGGIAAALHDPAGAMEAKRRRKTKRAPVGRH